MARAALVVSVLALVGAWGGPALADALLTGRDIKNESLTGRDVRDRTLTGRDMKSNSVTGRVVSGLSGRDFRRNSIDGSKIAEQTLDIERARTAEQADRALRADSATTAGRANVASALSGVRIARIRVSPAASTKALALSLGGLQIAAKCTPTSVELSATTTSAPAAIHAEVSGAGSAFTRNLGSNPWSLPGSPGDYGAEVVYAASSGTVVSVSLLASPGTQCLVAGTATSASG